MSTTSEREDSASDDEEDASLLYHISHHNTSESAGFSGVRGFEEVLAAVMPSKVEYLKDRTDILER